jgi:hypothetical protein
MILNVFYVYLQGQSKENYLLLHKYVEKVTIFTLCGEITSNIPERVTDILLRYAKLIADQGLFVSASKYCR